MLPDTRFFAPRNFFLLLTSSLAVNILALALPLMTMQIYDRVLSNRSEDTLLILSAGVLCAALVELFLRISRSVIVGLNGAQFEHEAAVAALENLVQADPRSSGKNTAAVMAQDIGAASRLKDYYGGQMMVTLLIDLPFILVFLGLEAYLAGWLAVVPCTMLALFLAISWHQGRTLHTLMHQRELQDDQRYSFITRALQVVHTIKSFCLENSMARRFEDVQRDSGPLNYRVACMNGQASSLSYGFAQLMTVAVVCVGAPMAVQGKITVGILIACVLLSGQVMQPLQRGLGMWLRFQDIAVAKRRLGALLNLKRRRFLAVSDLKSSYGDLRVDNVRFGYVEGQPIIDGANLDVAPGDAIAITGAAGSGKTTLLELMAGIYGPDRGRVLLSGMDVASIPISERPRNIAYLPINGTILRGSIMDNLTGFNPQARTAARQVADMLGIEAAVSLLPSGYDTPMEGIATDVVSPGLKQRISIARALLHRPRLVLFDNADHGMDQESYVKIFSLLARLKGKAVLVLVSEDRNIVSLADRTYELRRGRLVQATTTIPPVIDRFTPSEANV